MRKVGHRQRRYGVLVFPAELEQRPAGRDDLQIGAVTEQLAHVARRGEHLLDVVEHDQQTPGGKALPQPAEQRSAAALLDRECSRDRGNDKRAVLDRRQIHEERLRLAAARPARGRLDRQARLADARRAGQRQ
jgi:hypothetical protein